MASKLETWILFRRAVVALRLIGPNYLGIMSSLVGKSAIVASTASPPCVGA